MSKQFGGRERKAREAKSWTSSDKRLISSYGAPPKKGRGGRGGWGAKPPAKEKRRSQRQGWLAKFVPRSSQVQLRQYYDRMDADAARQKLARKFAGDQRELEELVRAASGKPLSGQGRQRIQRWLEDRAARMGETVQGVQDLVGAVLAFFRK